jgi:hypothetical protein
MQVFASGSPYLVSIVVVLVFDRWQMFVPLAETKLSAVSRHILQQLPVATRTVPVRPECDYAAALNRGLIPTLSRLHSVSFSLSVRSFDVRPPYQSEQMRVLRQVIIRRTFVLC